MNEDELYEWLASNFAQLPKVGTDTYKAIWSRGILRFSSQKIQPDLVDELSARLVCTALAEKQLLLISLPDYAPHRPAFLFATALLIDGIERYRANSRGGNVLYFGSTVGIRDHISQVQVNRLPLDSVFPQAQLQRDLKARKSSVRSGSAKMSSTVTAFNLPTAYSVYSPSNPSAICAHIRPNWIAVDCGDNIRLHWLSPLLEEAKRRAIPLIAWTQNPLALVIDDFKAVEGQVFIWPFRNGRYPLPDIDTSRASGLRTIFDAHQTCSIQPVTLESSHSKEAIEHIQQAYIGLSKMSSAKVGRLAFSALQTGWKFLRTLENLCVPLDLFEAEVSNYWGLSSLVRTREALGKYIDALAHTDTDLHSVLFDVLHNLEQAHAVFQQQYPPLWDMLSNLCVDKLRVEAARLFVFTTHASKKLFSLSLLAYHNITEDDLKELRIGLITLKDLYDLLTLMKQQETDTVETMRLLSGLPSKELSWQYWMVGLPSQAATPYITPLLLTEDLQVILYPYQVAALARRVKHWDSTINPDIVTCAESFTSISKRERVAGVASHTRSKITLRDAERYILKTSDGKTREPTSENELWEPFDIQTEFAVLMDNSPDWQGDISTSPILGERATGTSTQEFIEEALLIEFTSGDQVLLSPDEKVNVVISSGGTSKTEERYPSSLRVGDRIVFIYGQRKQSLLALVISRVHRNPAVNLHVKLVERWQEDLATAYYRKATREPNWNIDRVFEEMKRRGSTISDSQPLRNWLRGETLRPQDAEDLRRLADIFDLAFVREHYMRIHRAGTRLAGLHISLSHRLNKWLNQEGLGMATSVSNQDDIIDEELGLTFQDFRDSLAVLQVKRISREKGLFDRDLIGQLERKVGS